MNQQVWRQQCHQHVLNAIQSELKDAGCVISRERRDGMARALHAVDQLKLFADEAGRNQSDSKNLNEHAENTVILAPEFWLGEAQCA